ncbi:Cell division cycle protein 16-like [Papilio machaon]|uniref:Cell division cycle protein 16-like n=1 Tax=Papilio machaon TaxID=76193 RepID=A0A0N1I924_PAPMA|nr:Cell division cycle protein 16-like [Papilio machaon]
MAKVDSIGPSSPDCLNVDFMRSLVKQYSELGQWTSAFFWADAAAATSSDSASGDDIWLLASTMLSRGELHRAAHAITSRGLHRRHLLCLGVAMRAYISAKEPATALSILDECDVALLEPRSHDQTHNRALASVLVWKARALSALERREAAAEELMSALRADCACYEALDLLLEQHALTPRQARALSALERREAAAEELMSALRADCACYEALDLLLEQHALTPRQETDLIESLPINNQLSGAEGALLRTAYRDRLLRYAPVKATSTTTDERGDSTESANTPSSVEVVLARSSEGAARKARRLAAAGHWAEALKALDQAGPWACADVRAACLVELRKSAELFAFAHALVDAYPQSWTSWFAVGCYYYLIGKSEFARRYLNKAKSLEPGAGCIWLAYGHSFAAENEHDQAMAAYFKATQLMAGCHLPALYVGVECSLLNNVSMCERFLLRAATLHSDTEGADAGVDESNVENSCGWERIARVVCDPYVAHEAGAAAHAAGDHERACALWLRALHAARDERDQVNTFTGIDPARRTDKFDWLSCRALGETRAALRWHERALALRPARAASLAARGLCLALLGRTRAAADVLHAALARDPDDVVALALLDAVVDRLDAALTDEEIPQFPFPTVNLSLGAPHTPHTPHTGGAHTPHTPHADATNTSDMSMSFD